MKYYHFFTSILLDTVTIFQSGNQSNLAVVILFCILNRKLFYNKIGSIFYTLHDFILVKPPE